MLDLKIIIFLGVDKRWHDNYSFIGTSWFGTGQPALILENNPNDKFFNHKLENI